MGFRPGRGDSRISLDPCPCFHLPRGAEFRAQGSAIGKRTGQKGGLKGQRRSAARQVDWRCWRVGGEDYDLRRWGVLEKGLGGLVRLSNAHQRRVIPARQGPGFRASTLLWGPDGDDPPPMTSATLSAAPLLDTVLRRGRGTIRHDRGRCRGRPSLYDPLSTKQSLTLAGTPCNCCIFAAGDLQTNDCLDGQGSTRVVVGRALGSKKQ